MDDDKRTVMVAALSAYADLLASNRAKLDVELGKGKGKASNDEFDLTAEIQSQIELCGELTNRITDATSGRDIARTFESSGAASQLPKNEHKLLQELGNGFDESVAGSKSRARHNWENKSFQNFHMPTTASDRKLQSPYIVDCEPYNNPFTGLAVIPETGYEAGPSQRPPPPLREPPRAPSQEPITSLRNFSLPITPTREPPKPPSVPLQSPLLPLGPSIKAPGRPPKPSHLQSQPIIPPQPVSIQKMASNPSTILPPQRPAPSLPSSLSPRTPQSQQQSMTPATHALLGPNRMNTALQMSGDIEEDDDILASQQQRLPASIPADDETSTLSKKSSLLDLETNAEESRKRALKNEASIPSPANKNQYLYHIAQLASKALKAAGNMINISRTPTASQTQASVPQEMANLLSEPPEYTPAADIPIDYVSNGPPTENVQRRASQETLPPAYDTLSLVSRSSSWASISSAGRSSIQIPSTAFSSQTSILSPVSRSASSSPSLVSSTSSRFQRRKSKTSTIPTEKSQQETVSSLPLSNPAPISKKNITRSASAAFLSRRNLSLTGPIISPESKLQNDLPNRRYTVSSVSKPSVTSDISMDEQTAADAAFALKLYLGDTDSTGSSPSPAASISNTSFHNASGYFMRRKSVKNLPSSPPASNNPWKDHMAADSAFAKALQQEEYRAMQIERDQLLAKSIANGTAVDDDIELAYFMSRQTATLIELTDTFAPSPYPSQNAQQPFFDLSEMDQEAKMQLDFLEARRLEMEFRAAEAGDEASLLAARRLQAELDKEVHDEEASWKDWKKSNIDECIVCGDEQHREELVRPCEHGYCDGCLQAGFKNALASKTPFKCCKKVLSIHGCPGLLPQFIKEYEEMTLELSTPNPVYCFNARCAVFLPPRVMVGDVATCEKCKSQTCRHCRRRTHPGTFCQEDKETEAVKDLAKKKGWKTCPGCNHLIERQSGCLHMVCSRCQTAFCYRCSKRWKDCESTCPDAVSATHPKR